MFDELLDGIGEEQLSEMLNASDPTANDRRTVGAFQKLAISAGEYGEPAPYIVYSPNPDSEGPGFFYKVQSEGIYKRFSEPFRSIFTRIFIPEFADLLESGSMPGFEEIRETVIKIFIESVAARFPSGLLFSYSHSDAGPEPLRCFFSADGKGQAARFTEIIDFDRLKKSLLEKVAELSAPPPPPPVFDLPTAPQPPEPPRRKK